MGDPTSLNDPVAAQRAAVKDSYKNSSLIDNFMEDFVKKDANADANSGNIFLSFTIGIVALFLVIFAFLTCLLYAVLRLRQRCNPHKRHSERTYQKCCRWTFAILMLFIIALILYLLSSAISAVVHRKEEDSQFEPRDVWLKQVLVADYNEFRKNASRAMDAVISDSIKTAIVDKKFNLDAACFSSSQRMNINQTIEKLKQDSDIMCFEVIIWNDCGRSFVRNITTLLTQTDKGVELYSNLDMPKRDLHGIPIYSIIEMREGCHTIQTILNDVQKIGDFFSKKLQENVKSTLNPYRSGVDGEFSERGKRLQELYRSLSSCNSDANLSNDKDLKPVPTWVKVFEWVCFILIILIIIILIFAVIKRFFATPWKGEQRSPTKRRKCWSQETGSCLFEMAIYMMCFLFILAIIPIWWHFERGLDESNSPCKRNTNRYRRSINENRLTAEELQTRVRRENGNDQKHVNFSDTEKVANTGNQSTGGENKNNSIIGKTECLQNREVQLFLATNATQVNTNYNNTFSPPKVNELTKTLDSNMFDVMAASMNALNETVSGVVDVEIKEWCHYFNLERYGNSLVQLHNDVIAFVRNEMVDTGKNEKMLALCLLNTLKSTLIDEFENHPLKKLHASIKEACNEISKIFPNGILKYGTKCLENAQKMGKSYNENINDVLGNGTKQIHQLYKDNLANYRSKAIETLCGGEAVPTRASNSDKSNIAHENDMNKIWILLLLILVLFLPLIPIAIYLSRLYAAFPTHTCSCKSSAHSDKDHLYKLGKSAPQNQDKILDGTTLQLRHRKCTCNSSILKTEPNSEAILKSETPLTGINPPKKLPLANAPTEPPQSSDEILDEQPISQPNRRVKFKIKIKFTTPKP